MIQSLAGKAEGNKKQRESTGAIRTRNGESSGSSSSSVIEVKALEYRVWADAVERQAFERKYAGTGETITRQRRRRESQSVTTASASKTVAQPCGVMEQQQQQQKQYYVRGSKCVRPVARYENIEPCTGGGKSNVNEVLITPQTPNGVNVPIQDITPQDEEEINAGALPSLPILGSTGTNFDESSPPIQNTNHANPDGNFRMRGRGATSVATRTCVTPRSAVIHSTCNAVSDDCIYDRGAIACAVAGADDSAGKIVRVSNCRVDAAEQALATDTSVYAVPVATVTSESAEKYGPTTPTEFTNVLQGSTTTATNTLECDAPLGKDTNDSLQHQRTIQNPNITAAATDSKQCLKEFVLDFIHQQKQQFSNLLQMKDDTFTEMTQALLDASRMEEPYDEQHNVGDDCYYVVNLYKHNQVLNQVLQTTHHAILEVQTLLSLREEFGTTGESRRSQSRPRKCTDSPLQGKEDQHLDLTMKISEIVQSQADEILKLCECHDEDDISSCSMDMNMDTGTGIDMNAGDKNIPAENSIQDDLLGGGSSPLSIPPQQSLESFDEDLGPEIVSIYVHNHDAIEIFHEGDYYQCCNND